MSIRKRMLLFLWGLNLAIVSSGVMASPSEDLKYSIGEDKNLSLAPLLCIPSSSTDILNRMNQDRGSPRGCNSDWVQRMRLSGGMNIDWFKFGNTNSKFMGINYQRFSLNDVYLNLAAEVNPWTHAFASLSYDTATIEDNQIYVYSPDSNTIYRTEYSSAYSDNATGGWVQALRLEQAYVRFGNFNESPLFLQVGKQFQDFSRYTLHPITRSLTQSLSEISATSAKLGVIFPNGLHGSIAVFDDVLVPSKYRNKRNNPINYSLALGYNQQQESWVGQIGLGWIRNLIAANDVAYRVAQAYNLSYSRPIPLDTDPRFCSSCYEHRASGLALYGDFQGGLWTLNARYTRALQRFTVLDLPKQLTTDLINIRIENGISGAKPWAMGIQLGYRLAADTATTDGSSPSQQVYIGYQASRETVSLGLPKYRWVLGYTVSPAKNTEFALEWDRDKDFSVNLGGSGKRYNLVTLRSSVKFS